MFSLHIPTLIPSENRHGRGESKFWGVGSVCWVFQGEGEEDGGTVNDGVPFHQASGASLRGSIGATA